MKKIKRILIAILLILLIYTRFVNISWGLPYPFHPDERNMAQAIQQLNIKNLNPHFFAYGQFPLYLGYILIIIKKLMSFEGLKGITFNESIIALRFISALASVINVLVLLKIFKFIDSRALPNSKFLLIFLIFIFSPVFIQFSHFGTTESLLMLFYSTIVYYSLKIIKTHNIKQITKLIIIAGILTGLSVATKVSSVIFIFIPLLAIIYGSFKYIAKKNTFFLIVNFLAAAVFTGVIFSPYNLIAFNEFLFSMEYEKSVALGKYIAFYTRQFSHTIPIFFQFLKIFPYALGWPVTIFFMIGFIFLPWNKTTNFLRLSFLMYFIPSALVFAKWTRFMAPVFPIMIIFAVLFLDLIYSKIKQNCILILLTMFFIIPGIAYLSIYQNPDVRFTASKWIYENIPANSFILSETANVVDLPLPLNNEIMKQWNNYRYVSFNFYDLDSEPQLQSDLKKFISQADYVIVPSRRVFMNYKFPKNYPLLNEYYDKLFSGKLGFREVKEFTSYPKITLLGKTLVEFSDEGAEETWSVFDHPVIRIYKRN